MPVLPQGQVVRPFLRDFGPYSSFGIIAKRMNYLVISLLLLASIAASCGSRIRTSRESVIAPKSFDKVHELTKKFNIERLREANLNSGDLEIRAWFSCGLCASPTGYILRRTTGKWSGILLGYRDDELKAREIREPSEGWNKSWAKLESHYILSLSDAESINCNVIAFDGDRHQIEIRQDDSYRTYGYSNPEMADENRCKEAKEILAIYDVLKSDFQSQE